MTSTKEQLPVALRITSAASNDAGVLAELDTLVFGEDAYSALTWRQVLDLSGPLSVVATLAPGPEIIGFATVARAWESSVGWVLGFGVTPELRNRGIGGELLRTVIREACGCGISILRLTVDPRNPAVRLYGRNGFRVEDGEPNYYGKGRPRLLMRREVGE